MFLQEVISVCPEENMKSEIELDLRLFQDGTMKQKMRLGKLNKMVKKFRN